MRFHRHVTDFVEEKRAACRLLKATGAAGERAGESTTLMPEKLCLDQFARDGGHVDRDKRPGLARTEIVKRARHKFLAGARFTENEHGQISRDDARDHPVNILHRCRATDQRQVSVFGRCDFIIMPATREAIAHGAAEFVEIKRLREIFESTLLGRAHRRGQRILRRQDDHRKVRTLSQDRGHEIEAVTVGEHDIGDQDIGHILFEDADLLGHGRRRADVMTIAAQGFSDDQPDRRIVIDEKDFGASHFTLFPSSSFPRRRKSNSRTSILGVGFPPSRE